MSALRKEKAYEKYAWVILAAFGLLIFLASLIASVTPLSGPLDPSQTTYEQLVSSNPGLAANIEQTGVQAALLGVALGAVVTGVAAGGFRNGERWAWFTMSLLAVWNLALMAYRISIGESWTDHAAVEIIILLGLFLPYRKFFSKKQPA